MNIGEKIRRVRESKDFSQEYIATNLNISSQAYSKIERGETKMDLDRLQKIADILEVGVVDIMSVEEKSNGWITNYNTHQGGNCNFYAENTRML